MKHNVIIDDVEYVPKGAINEKVVEIMKQVLSDTCGFKKEVVESIIANYGAITKKEVKSRPQQSDIFAPKYANDMMYGKLRVHLNGKISTEHNGRILKWTIDDLYYINHHLRDDTTYKEKNAIANKLGINSATVGKIIWNLREGNLDYLFAEYDKLQKEHKNRPLQNNPEKRKEMGYYG